MTRFLLLAVVALFSYSAFAAVVDCGDSYPDGRTLKYSDGSINFPNGRTFRYSDGSMNYSNGRTLRYQDGSMNYPGGRTLRYQDGSMNYPDGRTMRYQDGSLNNPDGSTNHTGSVATTAKTEDGQIRVTARKDKVSYLLTVFANKFVVTFDISSDGGVLCEVAGESQGETQFKVDGSKGSAVVTVKPGHNSEEIKNAIEALLE